MIINVSNEDEAGTVTLTNDAPPRVGTALVALLTDLDGMVSNVTWQWSSASTGGGTFTDIASATSASYTPVTGDVGNFLKAKASYDDPQGTGKTAEAVSAQRQRHTGSWWAPTTRPNSRLRSRRVGWRRTPRRARTSAPRSAPRTMTPTR